MNQISDSQQASTSSTGVNTSVFWERLWRTADIQSVGLFIVAYIIYGYQPQIGASADALVAFYNGDRMRILIAAVFFGMAILNLMWFAAALRTTLADAGQDGWGAAATASSAAVGVMFLLLITVGQVLILLLVCCKSSNMTNNRDEQEEKRSEGGTGGGRRPAPTVLSRIRQGVLSAPSNHMGLRTAKP